jgi:phage terminase Nu1 subunit (DNA packaging protein)
MSDIRAITKAEFARERKVHPSRVTQWIRDGRVVVTAGGKVDADTSHARLDGTLDLTKGVRREGNVTSTAPAEQDTRSAQHDDGVRAEVAAVAKPRAPGPDDQVDWEARKRKDRADAQLAEMKALQQAGALTPTAAVQKEAMEVARQVRNAMLAIPDRIAPVLDPANPSRAHKLLTEEIHKALRELRSGLEQRAAAAAGADERELALQ